MKIEESFTLQAPRDQVFAFLSDVERVAGCVPGVEGLTPTADGGWEAGLAAQLGPIRAAFTGQVQLTATAPGRLDASGRGQDRRSGSRVEVGFTADLVEDGPGRTRVDAVADVTIRGRLGQFGTGVIRATATELIRDFVACADGQLRATPGAGRAVATTTGSPPVAPRSTAAATTASTVALVLRIVLRTLRDAVAALWRRIDATRKGR